MAEGGHGAPRALRARTNERFTVELPANPTAGYTWRVEHPGSLELVAQEYRPAGAIPGAAGVERFVFLPHARGDCTIRFTYGRAWEAAPVAERFVVVRVD